MKIEDAIAFWKTETGYRRIQDSLSRSIHGKSKYAQTNLIDTIYNISYVKDAIETLRAAMKPALHIENYFRGSPSNITETHRREGFFSVTRDPKKAAAYGTVYSVSVNPDVPRLQIEASRGNEVLLCDGMIYTYSRKNISVSTPTKMNRSPYLGNLYTRRKNEKEREERMKLDIVLIRMWCLLQSVPDEDGIFTTECDMSEIETFQTYSFPKKLQMIKERIADYPYKDALFSEVAISVKENVRKIQNLIGGHKINKTTKSKHSHTKRHRRRNIPS